MGVEFESIYHVGWDRKRGLAQSKIVDAFAFPLQVLAPFIDCKGCGLAVAPDVYVQADIFIEVHDSRHYRFCK
ncbi:MAG TPA: hypothetical protein VMW20_02265 [Candidatus Nanoarchaeia archaeon]|nr:hypothetical protein [Candidatus Nanoarchaeia archaeon]